MYLAGLFFEFCFWLRNAAGTTAVIPGLEEISQLSSHNDSLEQNAKPLDFREADAVCEILSDEDVPLMKRLQMRKVAERPSARGQEMSSSQVVPFSQDFMHLALHSASKPKEDSRLQEKTDLTSKRLRCVIIDLRTRISLRY